MRTGNFPTSRPIFSPSNLLCSECLELLTKRDKRREREADRAIVLSADIKSDWSCMPVPSYVSRELCLIKHKNNFKFVFIFLILYCHLCLGRSWNYSLKTIMSIIVLKKACTFRQSLCFGTFENLRVATVISILFVCPSAHPNGTTGLPQGEFSWNFIMGYGH